MAAKKRNADQGAPSPDVSHQIQDGFLRVQSKLRGVLALVDTGDVGAATMLILDLQESVEALGSRVVEQMQPRAVLQAA